MDNILRNLLMAQRCAHVLHWQVKSLSLHLALGELYDTITELMDELAEVYMGETGQTVNPEQSDPNHFSQQSATEFVRGLHDALNSLRSGVEHLPSVLNKYDDLLSAVAKIKYKIENLK